jgi:replicative DNA helicase
MEVTPEKPEFLSTPPEQGGPDMQSVSKSKVPDRMSVLSRLTASDEESQYLRLLITVDNIVGITKYMPVQAWFSSAERQRVFLAWKSLFDDQKPVNPEAVMRAMRQQSRPDEFELLDTILMTVLQTEVRDEVVNLVDAMRDAYQCRRFNSMLNSMQQGFHRNMNITELWQTAALDLAGIEENDKFRPYQEQLTDTLQQLFHPDPHKLGIVTQLDEIDTLCGGLEPGNMIVVGGIQGAGKTALELELSSRSLSYYDDVAVFIASLEMPQRDLQNRQLASIAYVDMRRQKDHGKPGNVPLDQDEIDRLVAAAQVLRSWDNRLEVYDQPLDAEGLKRAMRQFALKHRGKRKVAFIDHLGLVGGRHSEIRVNIVNAVKAIKEAQSEHDFCTVPLAQMLKELESPKYKDSFHRPDQSFIAEAGFINQTADTVFCLWRPEMYTPTMFMNGDPTWNTRNRMIGVTGKNRSGASNREIMLGCNMQFYQLYNLREEENYQLRQNGFVTS